MTDNPVKACKPTKVVMLSDQDISKVLTMDDALEVVERSFKIEAEGGAIMPPKIYLDLPMYKGDFRAMPAYIDGSAGIKWVSVYPDNYKSGLPTVAAVLLLCDPNNGLPLALMDGTFITGLRTGAAGGIAVKYLARRNSSVVGIIGAGTQARTQLVAINKVLSKIEDVKVFSIPADTSYIYAEQMKKQLNLNIHSVETIEEAADADIVITTTPSRQPILMKKHIKPGTHINAIGADAEGKQELDPEILKVSKIVIDNLEQSCHSGEINVPLSKSQLTIEDLHGTVGEVIANMKPGRENDDEITVFDSTGLAIQDMICAKLVYEKIRGRSCRKFSLIGRLGGKNI